MSTKKQLAIWIDHLNAHVMEYKKDFMGIRVIFSGFLNTTENSNELKMAGISLSNSGKFAAYYSQLSEIIEKYDEVLLFGPTNAKAELNTILSTDFHFNHISIELRSAGTMTDIQQYDFVKAYFSVPGLL